MEKNVLKKPGGELISSPSGRDLRSSLGSSSPLRSLSDSGAGNQQLQYSIQHGSTKHSFSDGERFMFTNYINRELRLLPPMDPASATELFEAVAASVLLPRLINHAFPRTIRDKAIIVKAELSTFERNINHDLAINAARELGCSVVNIGAEDLSAARPHLCLGLLWQIIKKALLNQVQQSSDELMSRFESIAAADSTAAAKLHALLPDGTNAASMTPEQCVLLWMNYHLSNAPPELQASVPRRALTVGNFSGDVSSAIAYVVLLRCIAPQHVSASDAAQMVAEPDAQRRAARLVAAAGRVLGSADSVFVTAEDIVDANPRLNLAFAITLFNVHPNLDTSPGSPADTIRTRKVQAAFDESAVDTVWIVLGGQPAVLKTSCKIAWSNQTGVLRLEDSTGRLVTLKRHEIQVIPTTLWEVGILLSARYGFSWAELRSLSDTAIYLNGIDNQAGIIEFLSECRRFSAKPEARSDR
eukprot:TRINITY_DN880_c0_g1_i1.p1 TRINITY_DN880_c0_g1~~TRINITY_DN880_c0_g1_i1.p1  ORF type:complete len:471 (+),score=166.14 TRINITY_DN880_c0_g1_i1:139-1551(+)